MRDVAVIVPTLRRPESLERALRSGGAAAVGGVLAAVPAGVAAAAAGLAIGRLAATLHRRWVGLWLRR